MPDEDSFWMASSKASPINFQSKIEFMAKMLEISGQPRRPKDILPVIAASGAVVVGSIIYDMFTRADGHVLNIGDIAMP